VWTLLLATALAEPIGSIWVRGATPEDLAERSASYAEGRDGDWVLVHAYDEGLDALEADFETRGRREDHRRTERSELPTFEELEEELLALGAFSIGTSVEGRDLWAIERGEGPRVRILAGYHGDETVAVALAMELARSLDVPGRTVLIVPVMNPDGYVAGSRQNANDVDLNRNHGHSWASSVFSGPGPFSEPESRALRTLAAWHPSATGLSLHSGAENIGYPWNHTRDAAPEETELELLGAVYAAEVATTLLNGADWYVTYGDSNDWSLGAQGAWEYTVELSNEKSPADPAPVVQAHLPAVEAFVAAALYEGALDEPRQALLSAEGITPFWTDVDGSWTHRIEGPFTAEAVREVLEIDTLFFSALQGPVSLEVDATDVRLSRPLHDDVILEGGGGTWMIAPAELAVGGWNLHLDDAVAPRAVLVSDGRLPVRIDDAELDGTLHLEGVFGVGTRVWALTGSDRIPQALELVEASETSLEVDISSLPADGTVDLLLVSKGVEVAVADLFGALQIDTLRPDPADTGRREAVVDAEPRTGCATAELPSLLAFAIGAFLVRRRRHVASADARRV